MAGWLVEEDNKEQYEEPKEEDQIHDEEEKDRYEDEAEEEAVLKRKCRIAAHQATQHYLFRVCVCQKPGCKRRVCDQHMKIYVRGEGHKDVSFSVMNIMEKKNLENKWIYPYSCVTSAVRM
eukprot:3066317-Amphidinium_carterae.1